MKAMTRKRVTELVVDSSCALAAFGEISSGLLFGTKLSTLVMPSRENVIVRRARKRFKFVDENEDAKRHTIVKENRKLDGGICVLLFVLKCSTSNFMRVI